MVIQIFIGEVQIQKVSVKGGELKGLLDARDTILQGQIQSSGKFYSQFN